MLALFAQEVKKSSSSPANTAVLRLLTQQLFYLHMLKEGLVHSEVDDAINAALASSTSKK